MVCELTLIGMEAGVKWFRSYCYVEHKLLPSGLGTTVPYQLSGMQTIGAKICFSAGLSLFHKLKSLATDRLNIDY